MSDLSSFKPQTLTRPQLWRPTDRKLINPFLNMISTTKSTPRLKPLCAVVKSSRMLLTQRNTPSAGNGSAFFSSGAKADASLPVLTHSKPAKNKHRLRVRRATNPVLCSARLSSRPAEPRPATESIPVEISFGCAPSEAKTLLI